MAALQQQVCWLIAGFLGCGDAALGGEVAAPRAAANGEPAALSTLSGAVTTVAEPAARPGLCQRDDRDDRVRDVFCADASGRARIASLGALQAALGVRMPVGVRDAKDTGASLLAHSTALGGEKVSELNPRAIIGASGVFMAFSRGVQKVEIAAAERGKKDHFNFYLVQFRQACNRAAQGCGPADLYTQSIESDWQSLTISDDEDLKNTASDCRQCHQRGSDKAILLMREYFSPWTHWFGPDQDEPMTYPEPTGSALLRDYLKARGGEAYANIAPDTLKGVIGLTLQLLVEPVQPLRFDSSKIIGERWPWHEGGYASKPERSATWDAAFQAFTRGEQLPLPFYAPRATDPVKQAALSAVYADYRDGLIDASELPDLADIFPDDPQLRAEIGLQTEPNASPAETLVQACGTCHNDVLDQSISRARFNVALARMDRAELDLAIARISSAPDDPGVMPPPGRRQIAPEKLRELVAYLEQPERSAEDDAMLEHAAEMGMTGGGARGQGYVPGAPR